jgi:hypothetical protein
MPSGSIAAKGEAAFAGGRAPERAPITATTASQAAI